jgi:predicted RNA-binding Zn ribbon-like protein
MARLPSVSSAFARRQSPRVCGPALSMQEWFSCYWFVLTLTVDHRLRARRQPTTAVALLATVARDAIDLLSGPMADRVRECDGDGCTLLFLDASRAARRRWCSMDACGARSKMAAY